MIMKRIFFKAIFLILSIMICSNLYSADAKTVYDTSSLKGAKEIIDYIKIKLIPIATDPKIVSAILAANKANAKRTQNDIKKIDDAWIAEKGATMSKPYIQNETGKLLTGISEKSEKLLVEIFAMDFQGCIVGENEATSDFWQGDEDKFIKTYPGAIFIDKIKYDESSKKSSMQISLPVYDSASKSVIGAITFTLDMDKKSLIK